MANFIRSCFRPCLAESRDEAPADVEKNRLVVPEKDVQHGSKLATSWTDFLTRYRRVYFIRVCEANNREKSPRMRRLVLQTCRMTRNS